jgi:hypothetical protein
MHKAEAKPEVTGNGAKPVAGSKAEAKAPISAAGGGGGGGGGGGDAKSEPAGSSVAVPSDEDRIKGTKLVHKLVEFSYRILHTEMDGFFTENADKFDQEWDDVRQKGVGK